MAMSSAALPEVPVGFRFHPTEEELVNHFLKKKMQGKDFDDTIPEVNILKHEPWDLPALSPIQSDDDEWFYFSRPDYKSNNRKKANRATERGFWKITSRENEIIARQSKAVIGKKRTLTFYIGKVRNGKKTNWVMHEYYIPETHLPDNAKQRDFVLCRLKKKDERADNGAFDEGEPSTNHTSDFENLFAILGGSNISEDLQIVLQENSGPEDFGTLFTSPESPHFSSMMTEGFPNANAGNDRHLVLQAAFGDDESEDEERFVNSCFVDKDDCYVEESSRTTLLNHSSEPKSLSRVYVEDAHKQVMSPPVASSLVKTGQAQVQSGPSVQLGQLQSHTKVRTETGQSSVPYPIRISKPLKVKYTSKVPEKPVRPPPPMARPKEQGQSLEPPSNDEQKGMKQKQTGITFSDWKGSFIVWKESPLSLKSYPPVVYISYMIVGLFLFIVFAGEVVSYGKW